MKTSRLAQLLLASLTATACVGTIPYYKYPRPSEQVSQDVANYYDYERDANKLINESKSDKIAQENPVDWWKRNAVQVLEGQKLVSTGGVIAACLRTPPGESYALKGRSRPDKLYENDIAFYDVMVRSNLQLAERYKEIRALINVAEKDYGYKDEFRALALRGLVAYERLLDHHRFILREIQHYDCLSSQAAGDVKWEDEALKTYQAMVKNLKKSGEKLSELQAMVDQEYESLAKPLVEKKSFAGVLDVYGFMHRVFGENTDDVEKDCRGLAKSASNYAFKMFACGYVAEKEGHDSKAKKFYAVAKGASIDYAGPAAKRTSYLDDWGSPLQTEEARKTEGDNQWQTQIDFSK